MFQTNVSKPTMRKFQASLLSCLAALMLLSTAAVAQDAAKGEKLFKKCASCHTVGTGARHKVGPILNGVVGRPAGQAKGYKYSKALIAKGIVWNEDALAAFIRDTQGTVKGTRMIFAGLKKNEEILDVIAYLRKFDAFGNAAR